MIRILRIPLFLLLLAAPSLAGEFDHSHAQWTKILAARVHDGQFDYAALKKDPVAFDDYLKSLQAVTPQQLASWDPQQRFAFWINTYNAFTVKKVIDHYPIKSIRKLDKAFGLKTVFEQEWIPLKALHPDGDDDELSLNDIEHGILRPRFKDARVHAAINCASISCPPLRAEAFVAERIDKQLDEQMRLFIANRKLNKLNAAKGSIHISEIFKWFEEDFERDAGSVQKYLAKYASEADAAVFARASLRYTDYEWGLNDVPHK